MAVLELAVRSDIPSYGFRQELEGFIYNLSFRYNNRMGQWVMDIADASDRPIIVGIPVLTNVDLTNRFKYLKIPQGDFMCIDETGKGRNPDSYLLGGEVKLIYVDSTEEI